MRSTKKVGLIKIKTSYKQQRNNTENKELFNHPLREDKKPCGTTQ